MQIRFIIAIVLLLAICIGLFSGNINSYAGQNPAAAEIHNDAVDPLMQKIGFLIILVCMAAGVLGILQYRRASREMAKRKKAETDLGIVASRLNALINSSPLPITAVDAEGHTILWNSAAERVFGWSAAEVLGLPPRIVPLDYQKEHITFRNKIVDEDAITGVETRRMRKDGSLIDVTVSSATIRDDQGNSVAAMGIYEDITDRKKAEDEARFLAAIIQYLPEAVCAINTGGNTTFWNAGAEKMLGYRAGEMLGKPITTVIPEDIAKQEFDHCLAILNTDGYFTGYESMRLAKDGRRVPVEITAVAIRDGMGIVTDYASIMADITDRKKGEAERLKSHMLESIGILAGGIAHDYNNLLTVILGNVAIVRRSLEPGSKASERLDDVENICEMASSLSKRLITFATGGDPHMRVARISTALISDTVEEMLKGTNISLTLNFPDELSPVTIDEGQIKQVFINLVNNAKEAMPGGGALAIRAKNISVAAHDAVPIREGSYVKIAIQDTGRGIAPENLTKIYDPYFTTKDTYSQKGLGLGLAVCYSIMNRHNGLITADSEPGRGTTFYLYLPAQPLV